MERSILNNFVAILDHGAKIKILNSYLCNNIKILSYIYVVSKYRNAFIHHEGHLLSVSFQWSFIGYGILSRYIYILLYNVVLLLSTIEQVQLNKYNLINIKITKHGRHQVYNTLSTG